MDSSSEQNNSNAHIWEYLNHYLSFVETPRFAVLLNGPWGSGKTHLVRQILDSHFRGWQDQWIYVSLYGISSLDQLNEAIFAAIYPSLTSGPAKLFGLVSTSALKRFGIDFKASPKLFLSNLKKKPYVFDDLERCNLPAQDVLGYINTFVEHEGCKVLVLAHEEDIYEKEGIVTEQDGIALDKKSKYRAQREKVIGKTLQINSPLNEAFSFFVSKISEIETKNFLEIKFHIVHEMCKQARLVNLRILQQTIWDFERVFAALTDEHRNNDEAMVVLLRLFFAISFEMKIGNLTSKDIASRDTGQKGLIRRLVNSDAVETNIEKAQSRYPDTDLWDEILSNQILIDTLTRGVVDGEKIRQTINSSRFFVAVTDQPAWFVLWNAIEQTEDVAMKAVAGLEAQFGMCSFPNHVELLHAFGLRLWLVDLGVLPISRDVVLKDGIRVLNSLYENRKLNSINFPELSDTTIAQYVGGYEVYQYDSAEYQEFFGCYKDLVSRAKLEEYPIKAIALLDEMENDPDLYLRRICYTNSSENIYARVPLLASIDADDFVARVLKQPPLHQATILKAFRLRYQHGALQNELEKEADWLRIVREKLNAIAELSDPFKRNRIRKLTAWYVDAYLSDATARPLND